MDEVNVNVDEQEVFQDNDRFVTVARFVEPMNAQMAKGMLESAGIECFLQGENANNLMALAFKARLQVHKADEAAAKSLLAEVARDEPVDGAALDVADEPELTDETHVE